MKQPWTSDHLLSRGLPPLFGLLALLVACLAPIWAVQWARQPFLGLFLEANGVVSQIQGPNWPGRAAGVNWSDRLIGAGGTKITTQADLERVLAESGYAPLWLDFERRDGSTYSVQVRPRPVGGHEMVDHFLIPYLVGLVFLFSGWWAYFLNGRQRPGRAFLMFTSAMAITTITYLDMNTTHHFLLGWSLSLPMAGAALLHLALVFPTPMSFVQRYPVTRFGGWLLALWIGLQTAYDLLRPQTPWLYIDSWRWGYVSIAVGILFFLTTLVIRIFGRTQPVPRQQSRIIIFGALVAFGPILFLYLVPSSLGQTPPFQPLLFAPPLAVLPLTAAYAVARYRMLDMDRLLSNFLVWGLITAAGLGLFYLVTNLLGVILNRPLEFDSPLVLSTYLFLLVVTLNPLHRTIQTAIDRVFYRTPADFRRVLTEFSRDLVVTPNLSQILLLLERSLKRAVNPDRILLYLVRDEDRLFLPYGAGKEAGEPLAPAHGLVNRLRLSSETLWLPSLPQEVVQGLELPQGDPLQSCQIFTPLHYEGRLIGFLALGSRRSGQPYSGEDLELIAALAGQSSLAVENARLFTNLERTLDETREVKNLMDDLFASITSGIITTDLEQRVTQFNPAAEHILGLGAAGILGRPLAEGLPWFGEHLTALTLAAIQKGELTVGQEFSPQLPGRGRLHLRLSCAPLRDAHLGTKGAAIVIDDLTHQRQVEAERERIRQTFGRVVAPRVRDRLLSDPSGLRLEGVRQPLTVLFADMSQFTPFSEHTPPEEVLRVLNSYLSLATQAILEEEGTLDKFLGDAVMAFWNAPDRQQDHALRAVRAALAMNTAFKQHRDQLEPSHQLFFTIGIHSGEAMVGNVGANELFNYTAVGDTVNLAQRLEAIAQPGQILLSQATYDFVSRLVEARRLPPVKVKGRQQEVVTYELLGLRKMPGLY